LLSATQQKFNFTKRNYQC